MLNPCGKNCGPNARFGCVYASLLADSDYGLTPKGAQPPCIVECIQIPKDFRSVTDHTEVLLEVNVGCSDGEMAADEACRGQGAYRIPSQVPLPRESFVELGQGRELPKPHRDHLLRISSGPSGGQDIVFPESLIAVFE
jgi:hypothetical protein